MDKLLLSISTMAGIILGSSFPAQVLTALKTAGILGSAWWAVFLVLGGSLMFYGYIQWRGWDESAMVSIALLIGSLLGVVHGGGLG